MAEGVWELGAGGGQKQTSEAIAMRRAARRKPAGKANLDCENEADDVVAASFAFEIFYKNIVIRTLSLKYWENLKAC